MPRCSCTCFNYVPVRGSQDVKCSRCHKSYTEHSSLDHSCPSKGAKFASSYTCSCTQSYNDHQTVFESRAERASDGRPLDTGWMEQAERAGLPVCHLGGICGFTSLADGVDRVFAGLEDTPIGAVVPDGGTDRMLQRLQDEDNINTASLVHGRTAGLKAIADARARRGRGPTLPPALPAPSGDRGSSSSCHGRAGGQAAATPPRRSASVGVAGPSKSGQGSFGGYQGSLGGLGTKANVHTLAGAVGALSPGGAASSSARGAAATRNLPPAPARGGAGAAPGGTGQARRRSASAAIPSPGGAGADGGRGIGQRLGGAPKPQRRDAEALRQARLAHFDA